MNSEKQILHMPDIGPVLFERSNRAKHINISIKSPSIIRVAVPMGVSFKKAEKFTRLKEIWIRKHLVKISKDLNGRKVLHAIDAVKARIVLEKRIRELAIKHSFHFNKLSIRNQRTRWGSCSNKNNISLNAKLLHLPQELIDYVILHELVHTKIKNHSKEFWQMLEKHIDNCKIYDKRLKEYRVDC